MRRSSVLAVVLSAALGFVLLTSAAAEQVNFSLAAGQTVAVGTYVVEFAGAKAGVPAYNLYLAGGGLVAQLPSSARTPNSSYVYGNVSIYTTRLSTDGLTATGIVVVK